MNPIDLHHMGFSVIPVKDKKPLVEWQPYHTMKAVDTVILDWQKSFHDCQWGIVTGKVSGILVLDIDGEEGRESVSKLTNEMPVTWTTKTRKGWHYYFKWEDRYGEFPTTKVRVFPGVDTRGNGGYVVAYDFVPGHSPADVELAPAPSWLVDALAGTGKQEDKGYRPGWILEALSNVDPGDAGRGRTATFTRIIGRLNRDGWAEEDIFALLKPHADDFGYDLKKLYETILDMCHRYSEQSKAKEYVGISASSLLSGKSSGITWCVAPLLPKEGIGILAGAPGHGKSWMMLDIATDVSMGRPWLGKFEVASGRVMYVDEESSKNLLSYRLRKLLNFKQIDPESLRVDFYIGEGLSLSDPSSVDQFRMKVDTAKPSLIIMDSLIRMHRAAENDATALAQTFGVVKKITRDFGCAVLFADHLRKPSPFSQSPDQEFRGSTEKLAAIDCGLIIHRVGENLLLEQAKARYTEPVKSFEFKIVDVGTESTAVRYIG